ncbi:MAG: hypothetical protein KDD02_14045 [Phaeodactylibacter sp.]|nr:hypothetical protein [Phaeodactylibacter sp.]MCB9301752.1 hypothetical protein [Lewinellaceae bacterium]
MFDNMITSTANRWLWAAFSLAWFVLVFVSYWAFHPYYSVAVGRFPNLDMAIAIFLLCGGAWAALAFLPARKKSKNGRAVNGLAIYGFILFLQLVAFGIYGSRNRLFDYGMGAALMYFLVFNLLLHGAVFLIVLLHYALGNLIMQRLSPWYARDSQKVLSLAVGVSLSGFVLVLLGLAGLLYGWLIWILVAGLLAWQWRASLVFVQGLLWKPTLRLPNSKWGAIPVFLLLGTIAVNNIAAIKLFPIGFDGAGLYMNTAHLISDYHGLPAGGQAFNWQVFLSLGELLFGQAPIAILLSHFSVFFCLFALYRLSRLFMGRGAAWLVAALLYLNPAVSFHVVVDEKIDLGFLFITLSILLLVLEYPVRLAGKKPAPPNQTIFRLSRWAVPESALIWALAGWLAGYAFGIKYTGLISILALVTYAAYQQMGAKTAVGLFALLTGLIFPLGVYKFGYLELGNTSPWAFAGLGVLIGLPLLLWGGRGQWTLWKPLSIRMALFACSAGLVFLPWMGKNLNENRQLSIDALLTGKLEKPSLAPIQVRTQELQYIYQKGQEILQQRGIVLDEGQQAQINTYLSDIDLTGKSPEEKKQVLTRLKFYIYNQVLNEEQQSKVFAGRSPDTSNFGPEQEREQAKETPDISLYKQNAVREEVIRYIGYEPGLPLYLSIPYDLTVNSTIPFQQYLDISFLFMLFFPMLFFGRNIGKNVLLILLLLGIWAISVYSLYAASGPATAAAVRAAVDNLLSTQRGALAAPLGGLFRVIQTGFAGLGRSANGFYTWISGFSFLATFATLSGLAALGYFLLKGQLKELSVNFKGLLVFVFSFGFLWYFLGNAIVWYGFALFSLLLLVFVFFFDNQEKLATGGLEKYSRYWMLSGIGLYLLFTTALAFINTTKPKGAEQLIYLSPLLKYASSFQGAEETYSAFIPFMADVIKKLNEDPDSKIYRVGTYFNYHIRFNDRRVLEDNQLVEYEYLSSSMKDKNEFFRLLKNNGFKYILFDLNTAAIDQTPEQSLARKTQEFFNLLVYSNEAQLLYTDNFVEDPNGGQYRFGNAVLQGKPGVFGNSTARGTYVLYELK